MLALKPHCERCGADLPPDADARICSFEQTYCPTCAGELGEACATCGGELVRRPVRPPERLARHPAVGPNGLLPAIPVLTVRSAARAAEFYEQRLGFRTTSLYRPDPERQDPSYRVVRRDLAYVHLDSFAGDRQAPGHVYLRVPDVDRLAREWRANGVTFRLEPTDQSWGTREAVLLDPDGNELHLHQEA